MYYHMFQKKDTFYVCQKDNELIMSAFTSEYFDYVFQKSSVIRYVDNIRGSPSTYLRML